jgi:hypothetical protein
MCAAQCNHFVRDPYTILFAFVGSLRLLMEERKHEMELLRSSDFSSNHHREQEHEQHDDGASGEYESDDDDARSISTIRAHELERVEEEDEDQLAAEDNKEEDRRRRRDELGRPRTPEPTGMGMGLSEDDYELRVSSKHLSAVARCFRLVASRPEDAGHG